MTYSTTPTDFIQCIHSHRHLRIWCAVHRPKPLLRRRFVLFCARRGFSSFSCGHEDAIALSKLSQLVFKKSIGSQGKNQTVNTQHRFGCSGAELPSGTFPFERLPTAAGPIGMPSGPHSHGQPLSWEFSFSSPTKTACQHKRKKYSKYRMRFPSFASFAFQVFPPPKLNIKSCDGNVSASLSGTLSPGFGACPAATTTASSCTLILKESLSGHLVPGQQPTCALYF